MILRRDSSPRRAADPVEPASVPDLARVLRQVRLQRGLDLDEAAAACGLPADQLADFEAGTVSRLPDRVAVLKALRRYADSLDLPGERYVLVMVEHWPEDEVVTTSVMAVGAASEAAGATSMTPAAAAAPPSTTAAPSTAVIATVTATDALFLVPETLTTTAALPAQPAPAPNGTTAWANGSADGDASTDQVPLVLADTGVTPAVRAWRPRAGTAAGDSVLVEYASGFVAVLLVICSAWLVVNHSNPEWLRAIHVPYTSKPLPLAAGAHLGTTPTGAGSTPSTAAPSTTAKSAAPTTTAPAAPRGHGGSKQALRITSVSGDHATFAVRAAKFVVEVHCVGGDAWVQVSGSTPTPVFAQVVPANGTKDFQGRGQLTMVIGSSAARLTILQGKKVIGTYTPPSAPFSMTFSSTS